MKTESYPTNMPTTLAVIALLGALGVTQASAGPVENVTPPAMERLEASPDRVHLTRELWAPPRSGFYVAQLEALNPLIRRFNAQADGGVVIRYARGDEGSLWAAELRAWLVALGIPSTRIRLVSVAQAEDVLIIENHIKGVQSH
jgi:type IV pilus biogenesis protein CpaD/CtpE